MRSSAILSTVICILFAVCAGCHANPPYHPDLFRISGIITDSVTGNPVDSAWVTNEPTAPGLVFYSDSLGSYRVDALETEQAVLRVGKEGYVTKERTFEPLRGDLDGIDFELVLLDSLH